MGTTGGQKTALEPSVVAEFLSSTSLFRDAERDVVDRVAPHAAALEYKKGEKILAAGVPPDTVGVLFRGKAAARTVDPVSGASQLQEEIQIGDHFGEVAVLLGTVQGNEIIAEEPCVVLHLRKDVVDQLTKKVPAFPRALALRMAKRVVASSLRELRSGGEGTAPSAAAPATAPATPAPGDKEVIPFVQCSAYEVSKKNFELIPLQLVTALRILPLRLKDKTLTIGMVDPYNSAAIEQIRRALSTVSVAIVAIAREDFDAQLRRLQISAVDNKRPADRTPPGALVFDKEDSEREAEKALRVVGDEVVQIASRIIAAAIDCGASDIHIEEDTTAVKVRFRVNGSLHDWDQFVPNSYGKSLVARYKVLAGLDITERRLPQDGRISVRIENREVDIRMATMPTSRGEKIVFRVLEGSNLTKPLDKIFLEQRTLNVVKEVLNRHHGAVFVAGATGSGKSSTLYSCINAVRRAHPDKNICMVEDPLEYRLNGVTQVQVNHAVNFAFSDVLRGFMRQDPDIIMVGEVRDSVTAQTVLEASLTGHLVMTSTHSHNAFATLQRLEKLGCNRIVLAQSLSLIMVQRLVRKVCQACVTMDTPPQVVLESLVERGLLKTSAATQLPKATGCNECGQTGFQGRIAALETLLVNDALRAALMADKSYVELQEVATKEGLLISSKQYAAFLMAGKLITPGDALLTVAG